MKKPIHSILTMLILLTAGHLSAAADAGKRVLTLPEAVGIAIENSPAFRKSTEDLKGAGYAAQSAKAEFYPSIAASYEYATLNEAPYMMAAGRKTQVAPITQYHWDITLVQPLFTGHAISTRHEMAKLGIKIKEKEKQQTILDIAKGTQSAYYRLLLSQKMRVVAGEAFETLTSHEKDAKMFFDRGIIRLNDLLRAQVALSNAIQFRERAGANVGIAAADLNRWLSVDINADTRIKDIVAVQCGHYRLDPLIEKGMKTRPKLQAMALVRETLAHAVKLEKSAWYPEVAAIGSYGRSGDEPAGYSNEFENNDNAALAIQAKWTFFDANKTRARVRRAESEKRAFDERIRQVEDVIRLEIKSAYLNLGVAEKNIDTAKVSLSQAEENLRITRLGYRQQAATSTEVLDARTDLTQAKTNYYQALYGYLDALAALERAIGKKPETGPDQPA